MLNNHPIAIYISVPLQYITVPPQCLFSLKHTKLYCYCVCNSVDWCGLVIYDLMITLRNAFSIFISNRDVMYLSDIKSSDHNHPATIYNCPATIYNCPTASHRNDYFVWMEQLHLSMKLLSQI